MNNFFTFSVVLLYSAALLSCQGNSNPETTSYDTLERKYVNTFACSMFYNYYLWYEDAAEEIDSWQTGDDPSEKVEQVRYKENGKTVDKWTLLTDDYESIYGTVQGSTATYGFRFALYYTDSSHSGMAAVVTYVSSGSPAEEAGLARGDCIISFDGKELTETNYSAILSTCYYGNDSCTLKLMSGEQMKLVKKDMYEDPVAVCKTFDCAGKKVGYLLYNDFYEMSYARLIEVCRNFKNEGVSELILDLRYNGGGYVSAEYALASMLAPEASVIAGDIYEITVCNEKTGSSENAFTTEYELLSDGKNIKYSTLGANIGLGRIYALVTSSTASAAESLIGNLKPYIDVDVIGEQTYGKFCSGYLVSATDFYESVKSKLEDSQYKEAVTYADNWGIYIMFARYADKNGVTLSMPSGIVPDYAVEDDPLDGYQLGDPGESMLAAALSKAGYVPGQTSSSRCKTFSASLSELPSIRQPHSIGFGMRIMSCE